MFENITTEKLTENLAKLAGMDGMEDIAAQIADVLAEREKNAAEIAARAELVIICRSASETLAKIRHSTVAAISDPDGTIVKNARLTLIKLLVETFGVNVARAEKIVMVLMDEDHQTDAAGDVEKAAAYVAAHPKSTVYSATRPDDADKGNHAPAASIESALDAGEKAKDDGAAKSDSK